MSRTRRQGLFIAAAAVAIVAFVALTALAFVDFNRYKRPLEVSASTALGMDVRIAGRLSAGVFPSLHVTAADGRILDARGATFASAKSISASIALLPLLRRQLRLRRLEIVQPRLGIERDSVGVFNVQQLARAASMLDALNGASVSVTHGTLAFTDRGSANVFEAIDFGLVASGIRFAGGTGLAASRRLSVRAKFECREFRMQNFALTGVKATIEGKDGVFELDPITLRTFGGNAVASLHADLTGAAPAVELHYSLPGFRIEEFLKVLSPKRAAEGAMDFSATLSMHGGAGQRMMQTLTGEISLSSGHLSLVGEDLDREIARFESSQTFGLVDVGAVFLAGPMGLAVTKGYNFASLFKGNGGTSNIDALVSNWKIDQGIARATDVAMATTRNRIVLQGGLDFVNERFVEVTVAVVDARGCPMVRQLIRGPFAKPEVEKPRLLATLTGPAFKLLRRARGMFPSGPCEGGYSGAVGAPK